MSKQESSGSSDGNWHQQTGRRTGARNKETGDVKEGEKRTEPKQGRGRGAGRGRGRGTASGTVLFSSTATQSSRNKVEHSAGNGGQQKFSNTAATYHTEIKDEYSKKAQIAERGRGKYASTRGRGRGKRRGPRSTTGSERGSTDSLASKGTHENPNGKLSRGQSLQNLHKPNPGVRGRSNSTQRLPNEDAETNSGNRSQNDARGSFKNRGNQALSKPVYPMKMEQLQTLSEQDPSDVILSLVNLRSGFPELLSSVSLKQHLVALILKVLAKALTTHLHPENKNRIMATLLGSNFFDNHIPPLIMHLIQDGDSSGILDSMSKICEALLNAMPDSSADRLKTCVPLCLTISGTLIDMGKEVPKEVQDSFRNLQAQVTNIQAAQKDKKQDWKQEHIKKKCEQWVGGDEEFQGEDFRDIPIIPTVDEIRSHLPPFLPENIVDGQYRSVQQYLDVHFRLLREDFVQPLRVGITEYQNQVKAGVTGKNRYKDIQVYHKVQVECEVVKREGVYYQLGFDVTQLKSVQWEASKRLIYGSLLCLSNDNFQSVLFATVSDRKPEELEKGKLLVKFEVEDDLLKANILTKKELKKVFVMVESPAYFEPYRHVLRGLQYTNSCTMPLQRYIIGLGKVPELPAYLHHASSYNMVIISANALKHKQQHEECRKVILQMKEVEARQLALVRPTTAIHARIPFSKFLQHRATNNETAENMQKEETEYVENLEEDYIVPVVDLQQWPSPADLGLDESQRRAMHLALSSELAIIQGPPGTGKTYVGLKIVKTLLSNRHIWRQQNGCSSILVVCFTNHALDQFLEGMLSFTRRIVRVGGRSVNEALSDFNLRRIRDRLRSSKLRASNIHYNLENGSYELSMRKRQLETAQDDLTKLSTHIFHEDCFKDLVGDDKRLLTSLQGGFASYFGVSLDQLPRPPSLLTAWLGMLIGGAYVQENELELFFYDEPCVPNFGMPPDGDENIEVFDTDTAGLNHDGDDSQYIDVEDEVAAEIANRVVGEDISDSEEDDPDLFKDVLPELNYHKIYNLPINDLPFPERQLPDTELPPEMYAHLQETGIMQKEIAIRELYKWEALDDNEVEQITNVWNLSLADRWNLYRRWIIQYQALADDRLAQLKREYLATARRLREINDGEELSILRDNDIIGMTTTGAAKYQHLLQALSPRIVIVEEAAEVLEAHIVTTLSKNTQHLILIGDHQQLRPNPTVYHLAKRYKLEISLFERFVKNGMRYETLLLQHRMRPEISNLLVPNIYKALEDHPDVRRHPPVRSISTSVFFLSHTATEEQVAESKTHANEFEAKYLVGLCRHLLQQGYQSTQITILTTYAGQLFTLRKLMPRDLYEGVRVTVVDNYQGEENDIILLSLVRSNEEGNIGFLKTENRVCVALSRARYGLFCVGNFRQLADGSDLWRRIVATLERNGQIGPKLRLICPQHPDVVTEVNCGDDFQKLSPEGGCIRMCDFILPCGHKCPRVCHPSTHEGHKCFQKCSKILCERGHLCPKSCYQTCSPCDVIVEKELPKCNHKKMLPCHKDENTILCEVMMNRVLPKCGHNKALSCHIDVTKYTCRKLVERIMLDCEHQVIMECNKDPEKTACTTNCEYRLDCGHVCYLKCHHNENQEHENLKCRKPCQEKVCELGHKCKMLCFQECNECMILVIKQLPCGHKYEVPCSANIELLAKRCVIPVPKTLPCGHESQVHCSIDVETFSTVNLCTKKCTRNLPCGHLCPRRCCDLCGECKENVQKIVPTCGHEVNVKCKISVDKLVCYKSLIVSMKCGHNAKVPCHAKDERAKQYYCNEPCRKLLSCGHACAGTCGQCRQGRLHVACKKACGRIQICGHGCAIPCAIDCPPCTRKCGTLCMHSRCPRKCGAPCQPCKEFCTWACRHYRCNKLCSETCDRPPCNESCELKLPCGHPCIGLCGERCPSLCRVCNYDKLTEFILFGYEEDEDARFVQLDDCGHCIEVNGLDHWMAMDREEIQMKVCPQCKTTIWRSRRYGNQIRSSMADVRKVKKRLYGSRKKMLATIARLKKIMRQERINLRFVYREIQYLEKTLHTGAYHLNQTQLILIENQINLLIAMDKMLRETATFKSKAKQFIMDDLGDLSDRLLAYKVRINEEQLDQLNRELRRSRMMATLMHIQQKREELGYQSTPEVAQAIATVSNCLSLGHVLSDGEEKNNWEALRRADMAAGLGITNDERIQIVKAINLSAGHWFKCPNGHIYAIGECGGAMERSRCNECGASIGGEHHRLDAANAHAREMDNSPYAAYSEMNNLANFRPGDLAFA